MIKKILLALTFFTMSAVAYAQQTLVPAEFLDQWEKPQALNADTKWVIFTSTKEAGKWVKETLETMQVEDMAAKQWLYVADISGMPSLITKFMAIPKMQDYKFPIALEREGDITQAWPKQEDAVNVYKMDGLTIQKVYALTSEPEVVEFFKTMN
ncbi:MAG: hypothetical protein JXK16_05625 [Thiotrichales bacterium]|nr:hypothetical protein [Thiotrichales bacterium]